MKQRRDLTVVTLLLGVSALACSEDPRALSELQDASSGVSSGDAAYDSAAYDSQAPADAGHYATRPDDRPADAASGNFMDASAEPDAGRAQDGGAVVDGHAAAQDAGGVVLDGGLPAAADLEDAGRAPALDARVPSDAARASDAEPGREQDAHVLAADGSVESDGDLPPELCGRIHCDCTFEGKTLSGRVQFVDAFGDFKVREVTAFADLKVRETSFPSRCGEWQVVTIAPDFTVELVTAFEDFSIEYSSFPGLP